MSKSPQFPIYIPSKGRYDSALTMRLFSAYRQPHNVIVEEQEYKQYSELAKRLGGYARILILDPQFQRDYDACMELQPGQSPGSGAARNFGWEHAISEGHDWYWCVDDNIYSMMVPTDYGREYLSSSEGIRLMEDFVLRYENVAMAGPNYINFVHVRTRTVPLTLNTRIYSFNLIRTDLPFRWRGRWNEDTILSLDLLKAGWATVLFNTYLADKAAAGAIAGGNYLEVYSEGTLKKSQMLVAEHPDVSKVKWKFGRPHHQVDYSQWKSRGLIPVEGLTPVEKKNYVRVPRVHRAPLDT